MLLLVYCYLLIANAISLNYMRYDPTNNGQYRVIKRFQSKLSFEFFFELKDQDGNTHLKRVMYDSTASKKYTEVSVKLTASQSLGVVSRDAFGCALINGTTIEGTYNYSLIKLDPSGTSNTNLGQKGGYFRYWFDYDKVQISPTCKFFRIAYFLYYVRPDGLWQSISITYGPQRQLMTSDFKYIFDKNYTTYISLKFLNQTNNYGLQYQDIVRFNLEQQIKGTQVLFQCNKKMCFTFIFTQNTTTQIFFYLYVYQKDRFLTTWSVQMFKELYIGQINIQYDQKVSNVLIQYYSKGNSSLKTLGLILNTKPVRRFTQYSELLSSQQTYNTVALSENYLLTFRRSPEYPDKLTQKIFRIYGDYLVKLTLWDISYSTGFTNRLLIYQNIYGKLQSVLHYYKLDNYIIIGQTNFLAEALNLTEGQHIQIYNSSITDKKIQQQVPQQQSSINSLVLIISIAVPSSVVFMILSILILIKKKIIKLPRWLKKWLKKQKQQIKEPKLQKKQNDQLNFNQINDKNTSRIEQTNFNGTQNKSEVYFGLNSTKLFYSTDLEKEQSRQIIQKSLQKKKKIKIKNSKNQIIPIKQIKKNPKRIETVEVMLDYIIKDVERKQEEKLNKIQTVLNNIDNIDNIEEADLNETQSQADLNIKEKKPELFTYRQSAIDQIKQLIQKPQQNRQIRKKNNNKKNQIIPIKKIRNHLKIIENVEVVSELPIEQIDNKTKSHQIYEASLNKIQIPKENDEAIEKSDSYQSQRQDEYHYQINNKKLSLKRQTAPQQTNQEIQASIQIRNNKQKNKNSKNLIIPIKETKKFKKRVQGLDLSIEGIVKEYNYEEEYKI